jgi:hypothetical protein
MKIGTVETGNRVLSILQIATLTLPFLSEAAVIWDGPETTFTKPGSADWTQPVNQDHLTPGIALTRADTQGLINIVLEPSYSGASPAGTTWAFRGLNGNSSSASEITSANYGNLTFSSWQTALGGPGQLAANILNRPGVIHLVSEDIYLDVMFTAWSDGRNEGGGGFSYTRTTPVPEPEQTAAMAVGLIGVAIAMRVWNGRRHPREAAQKRPV